MGLVKEFRDFAMRGNVVDLAVGVIIGAAFGRIVTSLVEDVIMPPIGVLTGGIDFKDKVVRLAAAGADGKPVDMRYGLFLNQVINFIIVALCIFLVVKAMNRLMRKEAAVPAPAPAPTKDQVLLGEIRDLLRTRAS